MSTTPTPTPHNDGGPAFPQVPVVTESHGVVPFSSYSSGVDGMSLRDWFAGNERLEEKELLTWGLLEALAGPRPSGDINNNPLAWFHWDNKWRAAMRYARADAMIAVKEGK